jgi:hypothetical protein
MKLSFRLGAFLTIFALASLPLHAGTKVVHRWVLPETPMPRFQKMLVARIGDNFVVRQEFEDEMKRLLAKYGVEGIQSYVILPPRNEMMERELKLRMKESSLDSVLVVRPKLLRQEAQETLPGKFYAPPPSYSTLWPFWNRAYGDLYPGSSYLKENALVRVEFNLFNVRDEKLIWNGETATINSKDFEKLGREFARVLVNQLKKDKIVRKK